MQLLKIFRRDEDQKPKPARDFFDVYHAPTMEAFSDSRGQSLGDWGPHVTDDAATAGRMILGLLRESRPLRRRFPDALTGQDAAFREWLVAHCLNELKLTATQVANVSAAYVEDPAAAV